MNMKSFVPALFLIACCTQSAGSRLRRLRVRRRLRPCNHPTPPRRFDPASRCSLPTCLRRSGESGSASSPTTPAIDRSRTSDIDLIAQHKDLKLVALLAPEHGIRGDAAAGVKVVDETDPKTGVPIYSLYMAEDRGPTPEMLKDVDVLVYDLQEVGGRTWTYVSTMALSMQAAAKKKIPFVVLDRPNPIGGEIVEGALLDPKFKSFVGMYPIPARHGMTVGELATLFNQKYGIGADLIVARVANWRRSQWFDETGLPWVNPSPNLRSLAALTSYPGIRLLRRHQPDGGQGHRPPLRADRRLLAERAGGGQGHERDAAPGHPLRSHHDVGGTDGGQVQGTDDPRHPLRHHRPAGVQTGPHIAPAHRRDPQAASARLRLEPRRSIASRARTR